MHGHVDEVEFLGKLSGFLGGYYLFVAIMNGGAALYLWVSGRDRKLMDTPAGALTTSVLPHLGSFPLRAKIQPAL